MYKKLWLHQLYSLLRSPALAQNLIQSLFLGFSALFILFYLILVGFFIGKMLPDADLVALSSEMLIYYFLADFFIRFIFQKFPSLRVKPYLTLNIPKQKIATFLCVRSLLSFFNLAPLCFFIPFYFSVIQPALGSGIGLHWMIMIFLGIGIMHFLNFYLSKLFDKSPYFPFAVGSLLALALYLDYTSYFSLSAYAAPVFIFLYQHVVGLIGMFLILVGLYYLTFRLLVNYAYLDGDAENHQIRYSRNFGFLSVLGDRRGKMLAMELKLIWRHKRPRTFLFVSLIFLLYPIYTILTIGTADQGILPTITLGFVGFLLTIAFSLNYGQLLFSWNSNHFDFLLTQPIHLKEYIEAKFTLLVLSSIVCYILALPYGFFDLDILLIFGVMLIFNIGITLYAILFLAIYSSKKIDMKKGAMMNYEGFGTAHYLVIIPLILIPGIIMGLFAYLEMVQVAWAIMAGLGIIGTFFRSRILQLASDKLQERKYKLQREFKK